MVGEFRGSGGHDKACMIMAGAHGHVGPYSCISLRGLAWPGI